MHAAITAIEYHLPPDRLTNDTIAADCEGRTAGEIGDKTGIRERRVAAPGVWASDLACIAATRLFESGACARRDVDYLLFCTQCPDYLMPSTAPSLQARLGLEHRVGALDFNGGCSGFVYGVGLAKGLIESGQANRVLLLTAETYSKFIGRHDRHTRSLFGDAAAATLIEGRSSTRAHDGVFAPAIGPFVVGSDGRGAEQLCMPKCGIRGMWEPASGEPSSTDGSERQMHMNGLDVCHFATHNVPVAVRGLMDAAGLTLGDIDAFVFHQASRFVLDGVRRALRIDPAKMVYAIEDCGNTASCSIPIALKRAEEAGVLHDGSRIAIVGFGSGYSWSAAVVRWSGLWPNAIDRAEHLEPRALVAD